MKTKITYNVCRENLGDDTTDAQYGAFKSLAQAAIKAAFPGADVVVGDSDFSNASTCSIDQRGPMTDDFIEVTREDVEEAVATVDESWWDAE